MNIQYCEQRSEEWCRLRAGSIGGVRFGQVLSGRKNRLIYDLLNESLNGYAELDDYINDEMQYGLEQEPIACDAYSLQSGIPLEKVGMILSDHSRIHHASPDRINIDRGIVVECKSTQNGSIHLQRFFEGVESEHKPQIQNYFAVSDDVKEVHFISWCPNRPERPLIAWIFTSDMFTKEIEIGRAEIKKIENKLKEMDVNFRF
jgi:hypothetical protein